MNKCALLLLILMLYSLPADAAGKAHEDWDIHEGILLDRVLYEVVSQYFDPGRIDPDRMLVSALKELERRFARIQVKFGDDGEITVRVGDREKRFSKSKPEGPWDVSSTLREVFAFLAATMEEKDLDLKKVERDAVNGILKTLDPHSRVLEPELFDELNIGTRGEFGGLGIKITTDRRPPCNGHLTIVEVFDGTPAAKSGLKVGDRIVRIGDESTVNITTSGAADRLRGIPGSRISLWIERRGERKSVKYDIVREQIHVNSVSSRMLKGKVGYISIEAFQRNSYTDFREQLVELHDEGMSGLIVDLRGNPGGLLEIAVRIADLFLFAGTIVTTAGRKEEQDVRNATNGGTEPDYPVAILVNQGSASAAEILAAALQSHGRAIVIGESTFGKGSVQVVEPLPDNEALKLTVAEYLTPGDFSIQALGVKPDVSFRFLHLDAKDLRFHPPRLKIHEKDLQEHLAGNEGKKHYHETLLLDVVKPADSRRRDEEDIRRCMPLDPDRESFSDQYTIEFAQELIARTAGTDRQGMLNDAEKMIAEKTVTEEEKLIRAAKKLRIDWSAGPGPEELSILPSIRIGRKGVVKAGKTASVRIEVRNRGERAIHRLRGITKSDNPVFDGHEFLLGRIRPGAGKSWKIPVDIPLLSETREDIVSVQFMLESGKIKQSADTTVMVQGLPQPRFATHFQMFDHGGNGDGRLQPGEEASLFVTVKNTGKGRTFNTELDIAAGSPMVDVATGRAAIGFLGPGETRTVRFTFKIDRAFNREEAKIKFSLSDWIPSKYLAVKDYIDRDFVFPVLDEKLDISDADGSVTVTSDTVLHSFPSGEAPWAAVVDKDAAFEVDAISGDFFRVILAKNRKAWLHRKFTKPGGRPGSGFSPALDSPPEIILDSTPGMSTSMKKIPIKGLVKDDGGIMDVIAMVGDSKEYYCACKKDSDPRKFRFEFEAPLEVGPNRIVIISRQDSDVSGYKVINVRRTDSEAE